MFKALACPARLGMLNLLASKKLDVGKLNKLLRKRQPNISQHLQVLKKTGIVFADKARKRRLYQPDSKWIPLLKQIQTYVS